MIYHEGFAHERFGITERVPDGGMKKVGNLIIGVPHGQFPEFEQNHTYDEWQQVIRQILTADEQWHLSQMLGRTIDQTIDFTLWLTRDYQEIIQTPPTFQSESGKRFWVHRSR